MHRQSTSAFCSRQHTSRSKKWTAAINFDPPFHHKLAFQSLHDYFSVCTRDRESNSNKNVRQHKRLKNSIYYVIPHKGLKNKTASITSGRTRDRDRNSSNKVRPQKRYKNSWKSYDVGTRLPTLRLCIIPPTDMGACILFAVEYVNYKTQCYCRRVLTNLQDDMPRINLPDK